MHISFIVFVILAIAIVGISGYCMGKHVNKISAQESPNEKNTVSHEDCLVKNIGMFNYGAFMDTRDGETYHTVQIGDQIWMVENLRFKAAGSYAPDNDESNVKKFGRLYTWTTALDIPPEYSEQSPAKDIEMYNKVKERNYQGIAPEGWHIPSRKE